MLRMAFLDVPLAMSCPEDIISDRIRVMISAREVRTNV